MKNRHAAINLKIYECNENVWIVIMILWLNYNKNTMSEKMLAKWVSSYGMDDQLLSTASWNVLLVHVPTTVVL